MSEVSEKVQLTKGQADAITDVLAKYEKDHVLKIHAEKSRKPWTGRQEELNDLTIGELARSLFVGYDVVEQRVDESRLYWGWKFDKL